MVGATKSCDLSVDEILRTDLQGNQCFNNKESREILGRKQTSGGGKMYRIVYTEHDAPDEPRVGMVSPPNAGAARQIAERQFINSTIVRVVEMTPPEEDTRFPGARFIRGEFRPVYL